MSLQQSIRITGNTSGVFTNPDSGVFTGTDTSTFTWGEGVDGSPPGRLIFTGRSLFDVVLVLGEGYGRSSENFALEVIGYTYGRYEGRGGENEEPTATELFSLGTLEYFNGTTRSGTDASRVSLDITLEVTSPDSYKTQPTTFSYTLNLNNTLNVADPDASADYVYFPESFADVSLRTPSGAPLTLEIEGFRTITGDGFLEQSDEQFHVREGKTASAELEGRFVDPIESIVKDSVQTVADGAIQYALFTPKSGLTIDEAAKLLGYANFNWYQVITADPEPLSSKADPNTPLKPPYTDPPITGWGSGSYAQPGYDGAFKDVDNLSFYFDQDSRVGDKEHLSQRIGDFDTSGKFVANPTTGKRLLYQDKPQLSFSILGNKYLEFQTSLVGVFPDGSWQALYTFTWKSNYRCLYNDKLCLGGVRSSLSTDTSDGVGGVFDLRSNLNPANIPAAVRRQMEADGAINASGTTATPLAAIDFSGGKRGRKLSGTNRSDKIGGTSKNDTLDGKNGKDQLLSQGGNDRVLGKGGNDKLTCGSGKDRAFGDSGKDTIKGDSGNDLLQGGQGNDRLLGGGGNDVLVGNQGRDTLVGGSGRDLFTFTSVSDGTDTINDFTLGVDLLDLRGIFSSSLFTGVDIFSRFTEFLQVVQLGASTQVKIDVDGAGAGTAFIPLVTLKNLAVADLNSRSFVIG